VSASPDGRLYISNCRYVYSSEQGVVPSGVIQPPDWGYIEPRGGSGMLDADMRMYCTMQMNYLQTWGWLFEMFIGQEAIPRFDTKRITEPLMVSFNECWMVLGQGGYPVLFKIDLQTGQPAGVYYRPTGGRVCAKDYTGRLWLSLEGIGVLDGEDFETFAPVIYGPNLQWYDWYDYLALTADLTVWALTRRTEIHGSYDLIGGITRFKDGEPLLLTSEDGLLNDYSVDPPLIDYDGNVWVVHNEGLSRISDGGWPPMRLMLNRLETPEGISVEAQVINNGPVVGVDVYVALQMDGQLLFWPNWQPEPSPVHVNLRPGHNQTATIISAPRSSIPPGSYTFFSCMTGRNTQKLIGPLDRKFESLTIEVN
jgi:hypothetical protein